MGWSEYFRNSLSTETISSVYRKWLENGKYPETYSSLGENTLLMPREDVQSASSI